MIVNASVISQLLQDNWSLANPLAAANISWPSTLLDALAITQGGTIQVAVYNGSPAKQAEPLSQKCYLITEKFMVDVIVRNAGQDSKSLAAAEVSLEAVLAEVYRIIHLQDPNYAVTGEPIHSNATAVTRVMINIDAVYFHISA